MQTSDGGLQSAVTALHAIMASDEISAQPSVELSITDRANCASRSPHALEPYQQALLDAYYKSTANELMFLPTGFGVSAVVDAAIARSLVAAPTRHVVVVVVRPSQALSHAARLSHALDASVGV
jgi:hypothetical protein